MFEDEKERAFRLEVDRVIKESIQPELMKWRKVRTTPPEFFRMLGSAHLLGFRKEDGAVRPIPWTQNIYFYRQLAQVSGGLAIAAFVHSQTGVKALHAFGDNYLTNRYLVPGMEGRNIMAIANTEPGAGSDAASISLTAKDKGDHYLLNGTKAYITNGDISDAIIMTGVTDPGAPKPHKGISMFVVDGDAEGLRRRRMGKYGWVESHLSTLELSDVRVPKTNLLGTRNKGFYQTMEVFNSSRIGIAALAHGSALGAFRMSLDHNRKREIFGKPVFDHGTKKHEYADRMTMLQAGWLIVKKAAEVHDAGDDFSYYASMAKLFNTEEGMKISHWAALNFGARGVLEGHPVSQYMLDSNVALIGEGAPEVQRKIISENLDRILERL